MRQKFWADVASGEALKRYGKEQLDEMITKKVFATCTVITFGCQMNARDSEKILGTLLAAGYEESLNEEDADLVLFNTCTVRENANEHLYGRLGRLKKQRSSHAEMVVGICGCMMQEEDEVLKVQDKYPYVDLIFGTHNLYRFAELLCEVFAKRAERTRKKAKERRVVEVLPAADRIVEDLPNARKFSFKQGVNISFGCNNFCSYCIVPYVRGRERSRASGEILSEVQTLAEDGVVEVMLLGQNVNSYGNDQPGEIRFPELLRRVCAVDGIRRVRFMTPHPKDLSDELIEVMATEPKICRHLHLPVQSGSTRILRAMNRHYTKESYLALVQKIRDRLPEISLSTDIIVGFPGETEDDFADTLSLCEACRFDSAYTFLYSKRSGTPAASLPDQIPEGIAKARFDRLVGLIARLSGERAGRLCGTIAEVLCEEVHPERDGYVTGRLSNNMLVHFPGGSSLLGQFQTVLLKESRGFYYLGETAEDRS